MKRVHEQRVSAALHTFCRLLADLRAAKLTLSTPKK